MCSAAPGWLCLIKPQTFDFGSDHDFTGPEVESCVGLCADSMEPAWDSLSLPLPCSCSVSLSK